MKARLRSAGLLLLLSGCTKPEPEKPLLPWQQNAQLLTDDEHRTYRAARAAMRALEADRASEHHWPQPRELPATLSWQKLEQGTYIDYLGFPAPGSSDRRWLIAIIEPEKGLLKQDHAPIAKADDEHHLLPDGTLLHVTLWSQPNQGALPVVPVPFPSEDGWTQSVGK